MKRNSRSKFQAVYFVLLAAGLALILGGCSKSDPLPPWVDFPDEAIASSIFVQQVEGLPGNFIMGADVSSFISQIESGVVFHDWDGNILDEQGFFDLLAASGLNYVRLRIWNDPYDEQGRGYGGGNNDTEKAIRMGEWATKAGLKVMLNYHYSDFWADPSKQLTPKAWEGLTIEDKAIALGDFTTGSLTEILRAGVDVGMVQIGNETNYGFSGETTWVNMAMLYRHGADAVRKVAKQQRKDILVAVHFTDPHHGDSFVRYASIMDNFGVDYDVFVTSYYSFWHGTLDNLTDVLSQIATTYDKKVMVGETSYVYTFDEGGGHGHSLSEGTAGVRYIYPVSVQGQATAVRDVIAAVAAVGEAGVGVFYWEPAWIPVAVYNGDDAMLARNRSIWEAYGSGWASSFASGYDPADAGVYFGGSSWENQAMFDYSGHPLASLNIWRYVHSGATTSLRIERVEDTFHKVNPGEEAVLPDIAVILYNNGDVEWREVVWDSGQIADAVANGRGEYLITGTVSVADEVFAARCYLTIDVINYVPDPSFEEGNWGDWQISDMAMAGIRHEPSNAKTGEYCLHFWNSGEVGFTAELTIDGLASGYYNYSVSLQGGDAAPDSKFLIYAISDERYEMETRTTRWQEWQSPEISGIWVGDDGRVTIGVSVNATAGAWGSFDDFYLFRTD
ncbi:MAG: glycosyl hydrolase 53 family protein [Lachnospiraceae bacterium]|jgi:arabinogalactan endo-1,4-beta-galactosidase|nr:glycosyl hydrolase 53 family protein [Lachnospiraceae bacterium]